MTVRQNMFRILMAVRVGHCQRAREIMHCVYVLGGAYRRGLGAGMACETFPEVIPAGPAWSCATYVELPTFGEVPGNERSMK
jgi:hypothetical protein